MKRQKTDKQKPEFGEVLGGFDLLPKVGYRELEFAVGDVPSFMFWGLYLVKTKSEKSVKLPFSVVDNLDPTGTVFVIKDTRVVKPIVINLGPTPAVFSVAELQGGKWYNAGLSDDRLALAEAHEQMEKFCKSIQLVLGILPLQLLEIHVDHSVKTGDDVYVAIAKEREKLVSMRKELKKKKPAKEKDKA